MRDLVPTSPLTSPLYIAHISRVQLLTKFFHFSTRRWPLSRAEICSCSLCSKFYTYLYHQIKLCQTNTYTPLQFIYEHNGDDEHYDVAPNKRNRDIFVWRLRAVVDFNMSQEFSVKRLGLAAKRRQQPRLFSEHKNSSRRVRGAFSGSKQSQLLHEKSNISKPFAA